MTSGDGTDAGELAALALATALSAGLASGELAGLAIAESRVAALVVTAGDSTADVDPADDGCLLVQAASAAAQTAATTQRAGVGLVVRSRLAMDPG
jgi:predicted ABC-type sugar transport system permease subunit